MEIAITHTERLSLLNRQIDRLARRIEVLDRRSLRYSWARVITFVVGLALTILLYFTVGLAAFSLSFLITTGLFICAVLLHRRVDESHQRFLHLHHHLRTQLARIQRDWAALPPERVPANFDHPFEADLDLSGERSLHRLLDTSVTTQGSVRLRTWMTAISPELAQTLRRQQLVRELAPLSLLRHRLILDGGEAAAQSGWEPARLLAWLHQPHTTPALRLWLIAQTLLAALNWLLLLGNWLGLLPPLWQTTLTIYGLVYFCQIRTIGAVFSTAAGLRDEVQRLQAVFRRLERRDYRRTPHLQRLCAPFLDCEHRPSHYLQSLALVVAATGVQGNPIIAIILNMVAPWGLFFAYRLDRLRLELAQSVPTWLETWYELEALGSLANFAYLNPECTCPTLREGDAEPVLVAQGIAHPLLAQSGKVRNDFTFTQLGTIVILTGSNMAGKSTFLKALGVNLVLAYAGGVVDAAALSTIFFRLFTCIKVSDSVTSGVSYFYAEVQRLKALLDALQTPHALPLFFVIDEILRGTNNRERLLGSRAYMRALSNQRGVGLIATHDLELAKLPDTFPTMRNYHFRDEVWQDKMVFDYLLRPGPSPTTNALKIMRNAGLPVDDVEP